MRVLIIAGGSCSGKSTLTQYILKQLKADHIQGISLRMDDYYKEIPEGLDFNHYKENTNFDDPKALDLELLKQHILTLKSGQAIEKPVFDFKTERRIRTEKITSPDLLVLEGTSALYFMHHFLPDLQPVFKIFIEVEPDILLKRRIKRDLIERGYVDEERIIKKDAEHVRPTFVKLIEPTKAFADLILNQETILDPFLFDRIRAL